MPHFKVNASDSTHQIIQARRVRRLGEDVLFEEGSGATWRTVASIPHSRVTSMQRRITELNGTERWINQPVPPAYIPAAPSERRTAS